MSVDGFDIVTVVPPEVKPEPGHILAWTLYHGFGGNQSKLAWLGDVRVGRVEQVGPGMWSWFSALPSEEDPIDGTSATEEDAMEAVELFTMGWVDLARLRVHGDDVTWESEPLELSKNDFE